jgi:hypothetical protein
MKIDILLDSGLVAQRIERTLDKCEVGGLNLP